MKKSALLISLLFLITCKQINLPPRPDLPDIALSAGSVSILSGNTYQFSDTTLGSSTQIVFTVKNEGKNTLTFPGLPLLHSQNTTASPFTIDCGSYTSALSLAPEETTTFTVSFAPTAEITYSDKISITSDDSDETIFSFSLVGKGIASTANNGDPNLAITFNPASGSFTTSAAISITSLDPTASIYYTIDGTQPSCNGGGTLYQAAAGLTLTSSATVNAIACGTNGAYYTASASYTINSSVSAPSITPPTGTYSSAQTALIPIPSGAFKISYTLDGSNPSCTIGTSSSQDVSIGIYQTTTVKAVACDSSDNASAISESIITITAGGTGSTAPTITPATGTYTSAQNITISMPSGAVSIRYTTDTSVPQCDGTAGTLATASVSFTLSATGTVRAVACDSSGSSSTLAESVITINLPAGTLASPVFSSTGGLFNVVQTITLTADTGAEIRYTTNGTDPDCTGGTVYTAGISIATDGTTTIKAIACQTGMTASAVSTASFTLDTTAPSILTQGGATGITPPQNTLIKNNDLITLTLSEPVQSNITFDNTSTIGTAAASVSGSTVTLTGIWIAGDNKTLNLTVTDLAGNNSLISLNYYVSDGSIYVSYNSALEKGTLTSPFKTIQAAVVQASTLFGGSAVTVKVKAGTYNEAVVLANGVSLYGGYSSNGSFLESDRQPANATTIQSNVTSGGVLNGEPEATIKIDNVSTASTIDGFVINGPNGGSILSSAGVKMINSSNAITLSNNTISGGGSSGTTTSYGVYLTVISGSNIQNNTISGGGTAITNNTYGLYASGISNTVIQNNTISGGLGNSTVNGIYAKDSSYFQIINNSSITGRTDASSSSYAYGIYLSNNSSPLIQLNAEIRGGLSSTNSFGINVSNSSPDILENAKIVGGVSSSSDAAGINISGSSYSASGTQSISKNTIIGGEGTTSTQTFGIRISDQSFSNTFSSSHPIINNTIIGNMISSQNSYGICILASPNPNMSPFIFNNVIFGGQATATTYGIAVNSNPSTIPIKIYNNTINAGSGSSNSIGFSSAMVNSVVNYEIINNLIIGNKGISVKDTNTSIIISNNSISAVNQFEINGAQAPLNGNTSITASTNLSITLQPTDFFSVGSFSSYNTATDNYTLAASSPTLVRAGGQTIATITDLSTDKTGTSRSGNWSIGAYEQSFKILNYKGNIAISNLNGGIDTDNQGYVYLTRDLSATPQSVVKLGPVNISNPSSATINDSFITNQFTNPEDISLSKDYQCFYLADTTNKFIYKFNISDGSSIGGYSRPNSPSSVAVGSNLYGAIVETPSGFYFTTDNFASVALKGSLGLMDLFFDWNDNLWGANNSQSSYYIYKLNQSDGSSLVAFPSGLKYSNMLRSSIALDISGLIYAGGYLSDTAPNNPTIKVFDQTGNLLLQHTDNTNLNMNISGIAVDNRGLIYVVLSDGASANLHIYR